MRLNLSDELIVRNALIEDIGSGDLTTDAIFDGVHLSEASLISKAKGIFAGRWVFENVFRQLDSELSFEWHIQDGDLIIPGQVLCSICGPTAPLLKGERTALNFVQRMSGIASLTYEFVKATKDTTAQIVDTRKTAPGLRAFDKMAVRIGGGKNHRMGLYDAVMIKDNHIDAAGGIGEAVSRVKSRVGHMVKIEVEARTKQEVDQAVGAYVDVILLDNMSVELMTKMASLYADQVTLEASGNICLENAEAVAQTGVHYISVGELTHSVKALDMSFIIKN